MEHADGHADGERESHERKPGVGGHRLVERLQPLGLERSGRPLEEDHAHPRKDDELHHRRAQIEGPLERTEGRKRHAGVSMQRDAARVDLPRQHPKQQRHARNESEWPDRRRDASRLRGEPLLPSFIAS